MELNAKKQLLTTPLKYRPIEKVATRDQIDWYELQYERCTNQRGLLCPIQEH